VVILLGSHAVRLPYTVDLNILSSQGESKSSLSVSYVPITSGASSDSLQCLEACEYVSRLSGSNGNQVLPQTRLLYDGLGYFVALTGTFLRWFVSPQPTAPRIAINMLNVFLYRRGSHPIQSAGYIFLFF